MSDHGPDPYSSPEPRKENGVVWGAVVAILAATVLLAGLLTALTKDDDEVAVDPVALLSSAPDSLADAGSARMAMVMSFGGEGFDMEMKGDGLVDFVSGAGTFTMSLMGQSFEIRTDGTTMWMHLPDMGPGSPVTSEWIAMPADQFQPTGQVGGGIDSATGMLDALRGIGGEPEVIGTEEIDGQEATHYRALVNVADAIAAAPPANRARAEAALKQFESLGASEMPVDVWITDGGLPLREIVTWDPEGGIAGQDVSMEIRVDFSDFGAPVEVEAPPADQVQTIDPAQVQQLFGGIEYQDPPS
jgi:hypothetical protein